MIEFASPWVFVLLPLPWLVWRFLPPYRMHAPAIRFPFFHNIVQAAGVQAEQGAVIVKRSKLELITGILVWVLLITALARPEQISEPVEVTKAARDVMLAIDISGSMDEPDFVMQGGKKFQRLEGVKQVVGEFIETRQGDRVGLIVFGTKAFVQTPFTEDLRTVSDLLTKTEVGMAGPNTVIGDAIGLSIRTFEVSEVDQRLLILLSDGADTGSRMSPINAAEIAARNGVSIYTIGVGDPEGTGEKRIDQRALEEIASRASGKFFYANDQRALSEIYARIDELSPRKVESLSFRSRTSLSYWPLSFAVVLALFVLTWLHTKGYRQVLS